MSVPADHTPPQPGTPVPLAAHAADLPAIDDPGTDYPAPTVLTLDGELGASQAADLQHRLVVAVDAAAGDVYLDVRGVTVFDDVAMSTLTAARSRAKYRGTRIAVLDDPDGVVTRALRRTGRHFRFPIFLDAQQATTALDARRAAIGVRSLRLVPALPDAVEQDPWTNVANPDRNVVD